MTYTLIIDGGVWDHGLDHERAKQDENLLEWQFPKAQILLIQER